VILTGKTKSTSGIATPGAYQTTFGGGAADAFVAKFDASGNLIWGSYLGGPKEEYAYAVSVDHNGNIYIGGKTGSTTDIATADGYQPVFGGGNNDGFVAKFSPSGTLRWCTYFGGTNGEWVLALANDAQGNVYFGGYTGSKKGIATDGAQQAAYAGGMDCYLGKLDSKGNLLWSTYFGGGGEDRPHDIQVDHAGNVIFSGTTPALVYQRRSLPGRTIKRVRRFCIEVDQHRSLDLVILFWRPV
jgi:hypothetical protein